jgi:hypothetical protein
MLLWGIPNEKFGLQTGVMVAVGRAEVGLKVGVEVEEGVGVAVVDGVAVEVRVFVAVAVPPEAGQRFA